MKRNPREGTVGMAVFKWKGFRQWAVALILTGTVVFWNGPLTAQAVEDNAKTAWSQDKRFLDNGDGTITDTQTGLMWMKMDSYQRTGHWVTWLESFEFVKKLNDEGFAGHYDWQLPALDDLKTLFERGKTNSKQLGREMIIHIDPIFAKEGSGAWWSREPNGHFNGFGVEYNNGNRFSAPKTSKARKGVRAVRVVTKP